MTIKPQISRRIRETASLLSAIVIPGSGLASPPQSASPQQPVTPPSTPAKASPTDPAAAAQKPDRSSAYYHFGLAHMYEDMAINYAGGQVQRACIEGVQAGAAADPNQNIDSGLAELYLRTGRVRSHVSQPSGDF